jgi:hypothetical protein
MKKVSTTNMYSSSICYILAISSYDKIKVNLFRKKNYISLVVYETIREMYKIYK